MRYYLGRLIVKLLFRLLARITVYGVEHIPEVPSFIAVSNHIGRLDAGLVYYLLDRRDIIMMVAEKYRQQWWSRLLVWIFDGIYIDRFNADLNALREVFRRLKKGGVMVVAPEGTRSKTVSLQEGKDGASFMAARSGLPIMPVGLIGTEDCVVVERLKHFKRLEITMWIGSPFVLPPLQPKNREEQLHRYTDEMMCHIAALLPLPYRGVYAEHPRLKEFLAEQGELKLAKPLIFG